MAPKPTPDHSEKKKTHLMYATGNPAIARWILTD